MLEPTALLLFCPYLPRQRVFVLRTFKSGSPGKLSHHFVYKPATVSMGEGKLPATAFSLCL